MSTEIGLSRKHKVFVVKESTTGTLKFPASTDLVLPAGNATINQNPEFVDSEELIDSLDIIDQFPNARPAGDWSIPMYLRTDKTFGEQPQGGILFESLQGKIGEATFSVNTKVLVAAEVVPFTTLTGDRLPSKGVIKLESELIYYEEIEYEALTPTSGTFKKCKRGYNGTTAVEHDGSSSAITGNLESVFYKQDTTSPSFSMWMKTDFLVQGLSGCTASELTMELNNEGAVKFEFSGQGMEMVWAGVSEADGVNTSTSFKVKDAKQFSPGARVWNETSKNNNSGDGFTIKSIDYDTQTITLDTDTMAVADKDVIAGYLPDGTKKQDPILSKDTGIKIDAQTAKLRTSNYTISAPKNYLIDEIGTEYPEEYVEDVRSITADFNIYAKKESIKYIYDGYNANEFSFNVTLGKNPGSIVEILNPRCRTTAPESGSDGPTMTLSMNMTALGTEGEDSCDIVIR